MSGTFSIIPAVDIKGGRCVRLYQGHADEETVFSDDPVAVAARWEEEGAQLLHVVDLDGAFSGRTVNRIVVVEIARRLHIPVEVGGGIRDRDTALSYVESGVASVVVGTAAFGDPELLSGLAEALGDRLAVGLDVKDGRAAVAGWMRTSDLTPAGAVEMLTGAGVRRIIYTDTSKDGTLVGPNFSGIEELARSSRVPLIASGGVGELEDVVRISRMRGLGVEGVIVGMALYRRKFTLEEAMQAVADVGGGGG
jgi:phosphoribosylformimino-5-aminoimidazole carboxamide ribotide isomerase